MRNTLIGQGGAIRGGPLPLSLVHSSSIEIPRTSGCDCVERSVGLPFVSSTSKLGGRKWACTGYRTRLQGRDHLVIARVLDQYGKSQYQTNNDRLTLIYPGQHAFVDAWMGHHSEDLKLLLSRSLDDMGADYTTMAPFKNLSVRNHWYRHVH